MRPSLKKPSMSLNRKKDSEFQFFFENISEPLILGSVKRAGTVQPSLFLLKFPSFFSCILPKVARLRSKMEGSHPRQVRVCEAQRSNESPSGAFKRQNGLAQQDGGASPRQVRLTPTLESHWAVPHLANAIRRCTGDYSASAESCYRHRCRQLSRPVHDRPFCSFS